MAYQNPRAGGAKTNPGGATKPSFQPRGGGQTPASRPSSGGGGGSGGRSNSGGGRRPDYDVFFAEKDENGKTRVIEDQDGKWAKAGALWLADGDKPPFFKVEADIPAGATLSLWAPKPKQ